MTPGGNFLKKEDKFYESVDEFGQKRYKIHVEYNLMPQDEAQELYHHFEEQELRKGKDLNLKINSSPVRPASMETPNKMKNERKEENYNWNPYSSPDNYKGENLAKIGRFETEQNNQAGERCHQDLIDRILGTNNQTATIQRYQLDGHVYEGYVTEDQQGNQFLVVDANHFKVMNNESPIAN